MTSTQHATTVLDPARQYLGCVMQLPLPAGRRVLVGMRPDYLADQPAVWTLRLVLDTVAAGQQPTPLVVLDRARQTTDTSARTGAAERLARLGVWLVDTYRDASVINEDHAWWLRGVLLREAWRRELVAYATRILQAAEHGPADALRRISLDVQASEELWNLHQTALDTTPGSTGPGPLHPGHLLDASTAISGRDERSSDGAGPAGRADVRACPTGARRPSDVRRGARHPDRKASA